MFHIQLLYGIVRDKQKQMKLNLPSNCKITLVNTS